MATNNFCGIAINRLVLKAKKIINNTVKDEITKQIMPQIEYYN